MPVVEKRVESWGELVDELFEESWKPDIERFRSHYAFRGILDSRSRLETSLMRLGGDFAGVEGHMIRNFTKYAYAETHSRHSFWHWLALAAHHSLPTRLLDWSYSPFVALHFATMDITGPPCDAAVWCVKYLESNRALSSPLQKALSAEGSQVFTTEMLDRAAGDLAAFDALAEESFLIFFEPPSLDQRIVNQFALFSLMSSPHEVLDDWLDRRPEEHRRIIIPAGLRWEVRDKLDQANINERVLFPGLDGLCRWLKRHYSPGPRAMHVGGRE
jgi:hypothetical protein